MSISFNSRTLGGVRLSLRKIFLNLGGFNSRTLGGVRREQNDFAERMWNVSIHAPWEGCDRVFPLNNARRMKFQFTHPGRGATETAKIQRFIRNEFQFTHPGRGATRQPT